MTTKIPTIKEFTDSLTDEDVKKYTDEGIDVLTPDGLQEAYDYYLTALNA